MCVTMNMYTYDKVWLTELVVKYAFPNYNTCTTHAWKNNSMYPGNNFIHSKTGTAMVGMGEDPFFCGLI